MPEVTLIAAFVWIMACLVSTLFLLFRPVKRLPSVWVALVVAFFLRLLPSLFMARGAGYEMAIFQKTADLIRAGENMYWSETPLPYLPFQIFWYALADWLAESVGLFFIFWLKLPNVVADTLIVGVLYLFFKDRGLGETAVKVSWLYALNPITIMVAAYQGQFDAIPLLFTLIALYLFMKPQRSDQQFVGAAIFLGLGVFSKMWPLFLFPILFLRIKGWKRRILFSLIVGLVPVAGLLLYEWMYPNSLRKILVLIRYAGAIPGWWGASAPFNVWVTTMGSGEPIYNGMVTLLKQGSYLAAIMVILGTRRRSAPHALLATILVLYATVPNLGLQSLSWLVPVALMTERYRETAVYIIGAFIHMVISYWGIHLDPGLYRLMSPPQAHILIQLSSLFIWLPIVFWTFKELFRSTSQPWLTPDPA